MRILMLLAVFGLTAALGYSAGPMLVSSSGTPIRWGSQHVPIAYYVDQGNLGGLSNAEAAALVDLAFGSWSGVSTTAVGFVRAGNTTTPTSPGPMLSASWTMSAGSPAKTR